jgi:hypothetical protein
VSALLEPRRLLVTGAVLLVCVAFVWPTPNNPPGFFRDEASIALSATALSRSLRDERGARLPLYFYSFKDYKSPIFVYALAAAFRATGPDAEVARSLAAVSVMSAILLLGLIAWRRSKSIAVALATLVLGATTPWLYELGRYAVEAATMPLFVCVLLVVTEGVGRADRWTPARAAAVGLSLGAISYSYAAGRLTAALFAAALVVFTGRAHLRWLATAWAIYLVTLVPLAVYARRHPGALTARYEATKFATKGQSGLGYVGEAVANYARDVAPWRWLVGGDPKPYIHASDYPSLLAPLLVLALVGVVFVAVKLRGDRWWRYVLALAVLAPIPAALTEDRMHQLRLVAAPVLLLALAIPPLKELASLASRHRALVLCAAGVLVAVLVVQSLHWTDKWSRSGPGRTELFEAGVPSLVDRAIARGTPVYVDFDDYQAQAQLRWRIAERGLPDSAAIVLPDGGMPPAGATVFGRFQACDYPCGKVDSWGEYWVARAFP